VALTGAMEPEQSVIRGQNVESACGASPPCRAQKAWQPPEGRSEANSKYFRHLVGLNPDRAFNNNAVMGGRAAAANDG
jgi:hypothetical protein